MDKPADSTDYVKLLDDSPPVPWRRIEVEPFCRYARTAAALLVVMGAADEVYPSYLIPGDAVWSLNGEPMLP